MGAYDYSRNLVSCWSMSDINPADEGWRGLGNDGVGTGLVAATDLVSGVAGGKATEFDGATEYIVTPLTLNGFTGLTLVAWLKPATLDANQTIFSNDGDGFDDSIQLGLDVDGQTANRVDATHQDNAGAVRHTVSDSANAVLGVWAHYTYTYDGSVQRLYKNGTEVGTNVIAGLVYNSNAVYIASRFVAGQRLLNGILDDLRVYDDALTALQVADLYRRSRRGIQ